MIVKNEEKQLPSCLESVRAHVDEIVVVDTGSTDGTLEVARRSGAKLSIFSWTGDFSEARNYALSLVESPWVLWLDADEQLDLTGKFVNLKAQCSETNGDAFLVPIRNFRLDGSYDVHHAVRLFRKLPGICFEGAAHEGVDRCLVRLGRRINPASFIINHFGYAISKEALRRKLLRNLESLEKDIRKKPQDPTTHYMVGYSLWGLGEKDKALRFLKRAYALKPPTKVLECKILNLLCLDAYENENYPYMERYARQSLTKISRQTTARLYLGLSLYAQKRYKEALPFLLQTYQFARLPLLQRRTALPQEHFYKEEALLSACAIALQEVGERVLAAQFFRKYRKSFGETPEMMVREGLNLLHCGAFEQAVEWLEKAATIGISLEDVAPPLAYALIRSGYPTKAMTLYRKYTYRFYQDTAGRETAELLKYVSRRFSTSGENHGWSDPFVRMHDCAQ